MSEAKKTPLCTICSKPTGMFRCHGCAQDFCTQHVTEHRQNLSQQFDEITSGYDEVRRSIAEYTIQSSSHPLMKEIDEWELKSIKKIQKAANDARKQLLNLLGTNTGTVTTMLETLTKQLTKARDDNTFVETDLQVWTMKLNQLKQDLNTPKTIFMKEDAYSAVAVALMYPISVPNDSFAHSVGNIQIEDNGYVIKQGILPPVGSARTTGEYTSGCHQFRFKIENIETNPEKKWIFFGIVSKATLVRTQSYTSPTACGWAGLNEVFCNGVKSVNFKGYRSDMEKNDTLQLFINCDLQTIRLTNERLDSKHQLEIDVNKCPFPWQVYLCLYYAGDKVRILTS
jgi:hypothetical protein